MSRVRLAVRGVLVAWIGNGLHFIAAFVLTPILINRLGTASYGIWQLVMDVLGTSMMIDLGLGSSTVKHLADFDARGDFQSYINCIATARRANRYQSSIVLAVVLVLALAFPYVFPIGDLAAIDVQAAALLTGLSSVVTMLGNTSRCVLRAKGRFDLTNVVYTASRVLGAAGMAVCALLGGNLIAVAGVGLIMTIFVQLTSYILAERQIVIPAHLTARPDPELRSRMFRFGAFAVIARIARLITTRSGSIVGGLLLGPDAVAYFSVASTLVGKFQQLSMSLIQSVMPMASGLKAQKDSAALQRMSILATRVLLAFALFAAVILITLGKPLIHYWLHKPEFIEHSFPILVMLSLALIVRLPSVAITGALTGMGAVEYVGRRAILEAIVTFLMELLFVPLFGLNGIALGVLVTQLLVVAVAQPIYLARALEMPVGKFVTQSVAPTLLASIPAIIAGTLFWHFWPPDSLVTLALQGGLLAMTFAIPGWFLVLDGDLRKSILKTLDRKRRKPGPVPPAGPEAGSTAA